MTQAEITVEVFNILTSEASYEAGLSNEGSVAIVEDGLVRFEFDAPGSCQLGAVVINEDGTMTDADFNFTYNNFDEWKEEFNMMLDGAY